MHTAPSSPQARGHVLVPRLMSCGPRTCSHPHIRQASTLSPLSKQAKSTCRSQKKEAELSKDEPLPMVLAADATSCLQQPLPVLTLWLLSLINLQGEI